MRRIHSLVLILIAVAIAAGCEPPGVQVENGRAEFTDIDQFLEFERRSRSRERHQVVMIGLDGANWYTIDKLIAKGKLPTFKRFKQEGAWGDLMSVECHFSPPAWTSMLTGFNPEKTGVYTFGSFDREALRFKSTTSMDLARPAVWDVASAAGRRVAVTNIPATYPPHPVNGIMISGLLTPNVLGNRGAKTLFTGLKPLLGSFYLPLDTIAVGPSLQGTFVISRKSALIAAFYDTRDDDVTGYDTVALCVREDSRLSPVVVGRVGEYSPWFQVTHIDLKDQTETRVSMCGRVEISTGSNLRAHIKLSPMIRLPNDPELGMAYPPELGDELVTRFNNYQISFGYDGDLVLPGAAAQAEFCDFFYDYDDWDLFLYVFSVLDNIHHSDGLSERTEDVYSSVDAYLGRLIERLPPDATLMLTSDHGFGPFKYIVDLNQYFKKFKVHDNTSRLSHSLVFHQDWAIYFNPKLLTRSYLIERDIPVADDQTAREALQLFLQQKAAEIVDANGNPRPVELVPIPDDAVGNPPDMIAVGSYDDYYLQGDDLGIRMRKVINPTTGRLTWFHTGSGVYVLWGNRVRPGVAGGPRDIRDVTPTLLYLLGLPMAYDFDGETMSDLLDDGFVASQPKYFMAHYDSLAPSIDYDAAELASLEDMLENLGYINKKK